MNVLSEDFLNRKMAIIEQVCEQFKMDDSQEVIDRLKAEYAKVAEEPMNKGIPTIRLFNKALGRVCADLGSSGGERFQILILAYGRPKDWNQTEREGILDAWGKGVKARANLIKAEKVMTMKKGGKDVVVSTIDKWQRTEAKVYIVLAGKEIEEGEMPIPRDSNQFYGDGKTKNNSYTCPLEESWNISMQGLVEVSDGYKPFIANIYNKWANPSSTSYLPKIAPAFSIYKASFGVDDRKTKPEKLAFNYITAIEKDKTITESIEKIVYGLVEDGHIGSYKEEKGNANSDKVYLVDLDDVKAFHDEIMVKRDDDGNILKGRTGYDLTNWDGYGIGIYYLSSKKETKKGNYSLRFRDWTNKPNGGFTNEIIDMVEIDEAKLPLEYLVSFSTTRKPTRWDAENKVAIQDPINGDVTFNSILGLNKASNGLIEGE